MRYDTYMCVCVCVSLGAKGLRAKPKWIFRGFRNFSEMLSFPHSAPLRLVSSLSVITYISDA